MQKGMEAAVMAENERKYLREIFDLSWDRKQETTALLRILRDETHSQSIKARCVALVGEQ